MATTSSRRCWTQYGLAALTRLGDESDEKNSTLRGDCLAGAYTASVILYNRKATSTYHISPGVHAGRGTAALAPCPIHDGTARRTSDGPDTATLPSSRAWDQPTSPRQIRVSVNKLVSTVPATS